MKRIALNHRLDRVFARSRKQERRRLANAWEPGWKAWQPRGRWWMRAAPHTTYEARARFYDAAASAWRRRARSVRAA